jgi:regulator of replication initiation timing
MADGGSARSERVAAQPWDELARTRRDQLDGIWRGAVVTVMVVGVVLATVLIVEDQGATRRAQGKDLAAVTDELAQLRQEVKDKHGEVTRTRARLEKTEKALMSKELENAELKKQLSLRVTSDQQQLAATVKEHCQCPKVVTNSELYKDGMVCEKQLSAAKDSLMKTTEELDQKKRDFRSFLKLLKTTVAQTSTLRTEISTLKSQGAAISKMRIASVLEGAMAAEAGNGQRSGGDSASRDDQVLKLLGVVTDEKGRRQSGSSQSNSDEAQTPGSSQDESDW